MWMSEWPRPNHTLFLVGVWWSLAGCGQGVASLSAQQAIPTPVPSAMSEIPFPPLLLAPPPGFYEQWWDTRHSVPSERNASAVWAQAIAAYQDNPDARESSVPYHAAWDAATHTQLATWVARNTAALRLAEEAAALPDCRFERRYTFDSRRTDDHPLWLPAIPRLAECMLARGCLRILEGNVAAAANDAAILLAIARQFEQQRDVFFQDPSLRIRLMSYGLLACMMDAGAEMEAGADINWASVLEAIQAVDAPVQSPRELVPQMTVELYNLVARYARDTDGDGRLDQIALSESHPDPLNPPRKLPELELEIRAVMGAWHELYALDHASFDRRVPSAVALTARPGSLTKAACAPALLEGLYRWAKCSEYARNWCRVMLHIHVYHERNGHWPRTLNDALGDQMSFAVDRYGNALHYELRQDRPHLCSHAATDLEELYMQSPWLPPACGPRPTPCE